MSRIGRLPIALPQGVNCSIDGNRVLVQGPKGTLERSFTGKIEFLLTDGFLTVHTTSNEKQDLAMWGTAGACIKNMVVGVLDGFTLDIQVYPHKVLLIEKPNFYTFLRTAVQLDETYLRLQLKPSRALWVEIPDYISVLSISQAPHPSKSGAKVSLVKLGCIDKEKLGLFVEKLIKQDPPNPYHDIGIRRTDRKIILKEVRKKKG